MDMRLSSFITVPYRSSEWIEGEPDKVFLLGYLVRISPESNSLSRLYFGDGTSVLTKDTKDDLQAAIDTARTRAIAQYLLNNADLHAIVTVLLAERARQDEKHGGPDHDDQHNWREWKMLMVRQLGKLSIYNPTAQDISEAFIKTGALCIAALESIHRKDEI
jgi:hypothetical protein